MILLKWLDDQLEGGSMSDVYQRPSPLQVGLQVPCCIRAQTTAESHLRVYPPTTWPGFSRPGETEGMPDRGGEFDAGPRPHVHRDPAQTPGCFRNWFLEPRNGS